MKHTLLGMALVAVLSATTRAQTTAPVSESEKPDIVLVHGAFADGSSWSKVISILQAKGYHVLSVQNPTTSLADDVAATQRILSYGNRPVVLVGHSWAGVVITQAGNDPKVKGLVYVDAAVPDDGQSISDAMAGLPAEPGAGAATKDENGFLMLPAAAVERFFAQDLSPVEQGLIFATQPPWFAGCLTDKVTHAAWHEKPSWWVIGENDHMINPKLQEKMAATIKAKVTTLKTSHVAMLADPVGVSAVIISAADAVSLGKVSSAPVVVDGLATTSAATPDVGEFDPAPVVALASQPSARLIVDAPLPEQLATGYVVVRYRAENVRLMPVYGSAALGVMPRIGHLHITLDDSPWHWLDASGEPLSVNGLPPGPHKILFELESPVHKVMDSKTISFDIPQRPVSRR